MSRPRPPEQGTRLLKISCKSCGYIARTTRLWLDEHGAPFCSCQLRKGKGTLTRMREDR